VFENASEFCDLIGKEGDLDDHGRRLAAYVRSFDPAMVGALHLTCADEAELQCIRSFQQTFVDPLLPSLRFWDKAPFRLANLGGRYEPGAVRIAEQHFETPATTGRLKVLVVKINAHAGIDRQGDRLLTGILRRYDLDSACCGALRALIEGSELPSIRALRELWLREDPARIDRLLDSTLVDPDLVALSAAVVNALLQAREVVFDLRDHAPRSPTIYLVVPCVSLNRHGIDTEIICGVHHADCRDARPELEYRGLGDDPAAYRIALRGGRVSVEDGGCGPSAS
jgi:hypothetical protein